MESVKQANGDSSILEAFDNPFTDRRYTIDIEIPEFTSMCPKTGHPDFGTIFIRYTPDKKCIELKSLKLYMHSWRDKGAFYEHLTNVILDDLVGLLQPGKMSVISDFTPRGGIVTRITTRYKKKQDKDE